MAGIVDRFARYDQMYKDSQNNISPSTRRHLESHATRNLGQKTDFFSASLNIIDGMFSALDLSGCFGPRTDDEYGDYDTPELDRYNHEQAIHDAQLSRDDKIKGNLQSIVRNQGENIGNARVAFSERKGLIIDLNSSSFGDFIKSLQTGNRNVKNNQVTLRSVLKGVKANTKKKISIINSSFSKIELEATKTLSELIKALGPRAENGGIKRSCSLLANATAKISTYY